MGQTITLTGMVLSAAPVGEYDRRVVLLTKERGKISAFARGARRPGNQLMAAVSPFSFGSFETYEGRSSYTIVKADIANYFRELAEHMENACYGCYFLELADYYARENTEEIHMLKLLYQSLRALEKGTLDNRLVRRIFELKTMTVNGEYPNVFSCLSCKTEENLHWFSTRAGGALCDNCKGREKSRAMDDSTLYAMQYIITSTIEKLYTFTVSENVLENLEDIMNEYMAFYVERKFHSLQILEENEGFAAQIRGISSKSRNQ